MGAVALEVAVFYGAAGHFAGWRWWRGSEVGCRKATMLVVEDEGVWLRRISESKRRGQ